MFSCEVTLTVIICSTVSQAEGM